MEKELRQAANNLKGFGSQVLPNQQVQSGKARACEQHMFARHAKHQTVAETEGVVGCQFLLAFPACRLQHAEEGQ
jgi:hypothetical protein